MPKRSKNYKARQQEAIIDVAMELIAEFGIKGTETRVLCQHTGFSKGTLHRRFPTKQQIVEAASKRACNNLRKSSSKEAHELRKTVTQLEQLIEQREQLIEQLEQLSNRAEVDDWVALQVILASLLGR